MKGWKAPYQAISALTSIRCRADDTGFYSRYGLISSKARNGDFVSNKTETRPLSSALKVIKNWFGSNSITVLTFAAFTVKDQTRQSTRRLSASPDRYGMWIWLSVAPTAITWLLPSPVTGVLQGLIRCWWQRWQNKLWISESVIYFTIASIRLVSQKLVVKLNLRRGGTAPVGSTCCSYSNYHRLTKNQKTLHCPYIHHWPPHGKPDTCTQVYIHTHGRWVKV